MGEPKPPSYDAATDNSKYGEAPAYEVGYQQPPYPPTATNYAYPPPQANNYPYPPSSDQQAYKDMGNDPLAAEHSAINLSTGKSEEELLGIISFDQKNVRLGFIRKVFAILGLQMAVTISMTAWFLFHEPTKEYVQQSLPLYLTSYGLFFVLYFVLACCTSVARKYPVNMILLSLFTLSLSYMVAAISTFHDTKIVITAFGITLFVSAAIIIFASQTKYDFTTCGGILFVLAFSLFFFGLFAGVMVPMGYMKILNVVYSFLGALLFMAFLAFDTQLIMGGRKHEISPEDYVFAAMMLYVDVIYILLFIMSLLGGSGN